MEYKTKIPVTIHTIQSFIANAHAGYISEIPRDCLIKLIPALTDQQINDIIKTLTRIIKEPIEDKLDLDANPSACFTLAGITSSLHDDKKDDIIRTLIDVEAFGNATITYIEPRIIHGLYTSFPSELKSATLGLVTKLLDSDNQNYVVAGLTILSQTIFYYPTEEGINPDFINLTIDKLNKILPGVSNPLIEDLITDSLFTLAIKQTPHKTIRRRVFKILFQTLKDNETKRINLALKTDRQSEKIKADLWKKNVSISKKIIQLAPLYAFEIEDLKPQEQNLTLLKLTRQICNSVTSPQLKSKEETCTSSSSSSSAAPFASAAPATMFSSASSNSSSSSSSSYHDYRPVPGESCGGGGSKP